MDPANASHWPPIFFLADPLFASTPYHWAMTDSSVPRPADARCGARWRSTSSWNSAGSCWTSRSRCTCATRVQEVYIAPLVPCSWEAVRDKMMRCLLGIHARDLEEQQLSKADNPLQGPHHLFAQQLAAMLPCLSILNNIPFASPFEVRVSIFRHFMLNDIGGRGNKKNELYPNPHAYATDGTSRT
ncbi:hypothetical protein BJ912DRAFT_619737 [Pholiota molesta]|nr:hypothetical protein BJ912DRAFT_619737 [Pholiota molesta]